MNLNKSKIIIIVTILYLVLFYAFASGLVNSLLQQDSIPKGMTIVPSRSIQSISETVIFVFILFIGMSGAYLIYRSGTTSTLKHQYAFLVAGFAIMSLSLLLGFHLVNSKV